MKRYFPKSFSFLDRASFEKKKKKTVKKNLKQRKYQKYHDSKVSETCYKYKTVFVTLIVQGFY